MDYFGEFYIEGIYGLLKEHGELSYRGVFEFIFLNLTVFIIFIPFIF